MASSNKEILSKIQSVDSICSRDSEDEIFPREKQLKENFETTSQINKSLENIVLEAPKDSRTEKEDFNENLNNSNSAFNEDFKVGSHIEVVDSVEKEEFLEKSFQTANEDLITNKENVDGAVVDISEDLHFDPEFSKQLELTEEENKKESLEYESINNESSNEGINENYIENEDKLDKNDLDNKHSEQNFINVDESTQNNDNDGIEHLRVKHTSTSEEVVEVSFEEVKGQLPISNSSKSLLKFFNDSSASKLAVKNIDEDGKNFFDSFTASQKDKESENNEFGGMALLETKIPTTIISQTTELPKNPSNTFINNITDSVNFSSSGPTNQPINPSSVNPYPNLPDSSFDAWIPPKETTITLSTLLTISPSIPLPIEQLTLPGIIISHRLNDPVVELMDKYLEKDAAVVRVMDCKQVPQNLQGLLTLIHNGSLRAAIELTGNLLTSCGQGPGKLNLPSSHSTFSLQAWQRILVDNVKTNCPSLWLCRFSLLHRLGLHSLAEEEWKAFHNLDTPDLYYQFHLTKYPGRKGSMVPFEMRLLQAQHHRYMGRPQQCLQLLCFCLAIVKEIKKNVTKGLSEDGNTSRMGEEMNGQKKKESLSLWTTRKLRVLYCMADCLLHIKDYYNSIKMYKRLLRKDPCNHDPLQLTLARIFLQAGDIDSASKHFSKVKSQSPEQLRMNNSLLEMARGRYNEAYEKLRVVADADKLNVVANCNSSVYVLYAGKLKTALKRLEVLLFNNPVLYLQEIVVLNLCTLYELESLKAPLKKQALLRTLHKHPQPFNPACLKLA